MYNVGKTRGVKALRKYIIGFIVGVFLTLPAAIYADEVSNVGKRIAAEFPVVLNGQELPVKAVAFEGTSYVPVRALAEALGLEVDFKDRAVILETKGDSEEMTETTFEGLKAVISGGKTYFNLRYYSEKFTPYEWGYDRTRNVTYLAEYESKESSVVKRVLMEVDLNDPSTHTVYKGETYVSIDYYHEPSDFEAAE